MRTGFIGDVHGDIEALRWALESLADVDRVICLGDVVDGPEDAACVQLLQQRGTLVLQGNHDFWTARDLRMGNPQSSTTCSWLASLPLEVSEGDWLAYHSWHERRGRDDVSWQYLDNERALNRALAETSCRLIFCAHTHIPAINVAEDRRLRYVSTSLLREAPRQRLDPGLRYIVNVGRPTDCVVVYRPGDDEHVEFLFRPLPPRPSRPQPPPTWWNLLLARLGIYRKL